MEVKHFFLINFLKHFDVSLRGGLVLTGSKRKVFPNRTPNKVHSYNTINDVMLDIFPHFFDSPFCEFNRVTVSTDITIEVRSISSY